MVQAADFRKLYDLARRRELDRPEVWSVLVQREMGARPVIVSEVGDEDAPQVPLIEDDDMLQALAPYRADEALCEGILPRALRRRENLLDPHAFGAMSERLTVNPVTIMQEIGWRGVVWEGVDKLLSGPVGGGVLGHVDVDDSPAMVSEYDVH